MFRKIQLTAKIRLQPWVIYSFKWYFARCVFNNSNNRVFGLCCTALNVTLWKFLTSLLFVLKKNMYVQKNHLHHLVNKWSFWISLKVLPCNYITGILQIMWLFGKWFFKQIWIFRKILKFLREKWDLWTSFWRISG